MPQTRHHVLLGILLLGLVLVLVCALQGRSRLVKFRATHPVPQYVDVQHATDIPFKTDFDRWMTQVPWFMHQRAHYLGDSFPYPPLMIALLAPLTLLSPPNAMLVFTLLKLPILALILWLGCRIVKRANVPLSPAALTLVALAWVWPVSGDLQEGQTNLLMLLPLVAALYFAQRQTPWNDVFAGVLLALAMTLKVTPLIFLIYFLLRRRLLLAFCTVLGVFVWLLLPAAFFGYDQNLLWLHQWTDIMILPYATSGQATYGGGQSIPSLLQRFLTHVPAYFYRPAGSTVEVPVYFNVLNLPPAALPWITTGVLGAIGVAGLIFLRPFTRLATFRSSRYLVEIGLIASFMLWASERTWIPHYVSVIIPLLAAAALVSFPQIPLRTRKYLLGCLVLSCVGFALAFDVTKLWRPLDGPEFFRTLGVALIPSLLTALGLMLAAPQIPKPPSPQPEAAKP